MEYQIGQYVWALNTINCDEGKITEITQSTGTRKDNLYKVKGNYYFADDIKQVFEAEDIEEKMEDEIYNLVMKRVKTKETKKYGTLYILTLPNKQIINVRDNSGTLVKIKKIIISNPCNKVKGHILFEDIDHVVYSYLTFKHQLFDIYSSLFRYIYK